MLHFEIQFYDEMGRVSVAHERTQDNNLTRGGRFFLVRDGQKIPVDWQATVTYIDWQETVTYTAEVDE